MAKCRINPARVLKIILNILLQDISYIISLYLDNLHTWNPNDPCFGWKKPCLEGFTFKNRGHVGSGYIQPSLSTATCTMLGQDMTGPNILQMYTLIHLFDHLISLALP